jgi:hypothetical protein
VHGNSGRSQDPGAKANPHGWGIEYDVAGTGSWLQYSIPINTGTKIKAIRIFFTKSGQHYKKGWIRNVHIYDGPYCIKKFDDLYLGKDSTDKTINKVLNIGKSLQCNYGIGVSILPQTYVASGLKAIVNFEFHSICAITP